MLEMVDIRRFIELRLKYLKFNKLNMLLFCVYIWKVYCFLIEYGNYCNNCFNF